MDSINTNKLQQPPIIKTFTIKRICLISLIVSLSISALVAIFVFLFGNFQEIEIKFLATTLIIGGYSLTGLCTSILYDQKKYIPLTLSGIIVSILGFLTAFVLIWEISDFDYILNAAIIFIILALSIAHISLLLLIRSDKKVINASLAATIVFITIVALMLTYLPLSDFDDVDEFYYRILGVFAVLDVLGTIVTPILKKFNS